jgi:integrase
VACCAGSRGDETPRRFGLAGAEIEIAEVVDRWLALDHRYFKVRDGNGDLYILRNDALLRSAELPAIRFHDLRHTAATLLLAQGVDPRTIMETLGHSQISLTLNTYSHVLPSLQKEAATKMDALLG